VTGRMARAVTIAPVGTPGVAAELGRKGTSSDVTLYNAVRDGHAVTVVEPTQFPEKFPPLLFALAMADRAVFVVAALTREIAETAATLPMFDLPMEILLGPAVGEEELRRAFRGSPLETAPARPLDPVQLRAEVDGWEAAPRPGPVMVPLDHSFPVKGVGAVALGVVRQGTLKAHDRLRLYPTETEVEARSIQVHDVDVREATIGERVGVALKGVESDELSRGQILAPPGSLAVATTLAGGPLERSRYYRGTATAGTQLQLLVGLQLVPAKLEAAGPEGVRIAADRPVAFRPGDRAVLADLSPASGPRIVGRTTLKG
jgi:selenocysteine-specific translation elongation factor